MGQNGQQQIGNHHHGGPIGGGSQARLGNPTPQRCVDGGPFAFLQGFADATEGFLALAGQLFANRLQKGLFFRGQVLQVAIAQGFVHYVQIAQFSQNSGHLPHGPLAGSFGQVNGHGKTHNGRSQPSQGHAHLV